MTALTLRLTAYLLLGLAGAGGGLALYLQKRQLWRQTHTFARLLDYLGQDIRYRALPGADLLKAAACHHEFATLGLEHCQALTELPLPPALQEICGVELQEGLESIASAPRESACATLARLAALCRTVEEEQRCAAANAKNLYPKLGACLGLMFAVFFS